MHVRILGSAAGGGFPQWNCACAVCALAWGGDPRVEARTQSSVAVSADGRRWFLLNASPDLKQQILANPPLQPSAPGRHSPIAGVVLTNADVDHLGGLLSLRERQPLAIYATERVHGTIDANPIFKVLNPNDVGRHRLAPDRATELTGPDGKPSGLSVEPFIVPGKVALWLEGGAASAEDTIGLVVRETSSDARLVYAPACAAVDTALRRRLDGASLLLFDGTLWQDDEMIRAGVGEKTGQRMGHISISGPDGALAALADARVARKLFIHINNTNPILIGGSAERQQVTAAGWAVARDGEEFEL
jgi:pyrroloquinoline quinone biosynthesis protein B